MRTLDAPSTIAERSPSAPAPPKRPFWRPLALVGLLLAAVLVAGLVVRPLLTPRAQPLKVSGRIDGYETDIGAKIPGRISFVAVREGDRVHKGQVVVRLDDDELQAQLRGSAARIAAAEQSVEQTRAHESVIANQIDEGALGVQQADADAAGRIEAATSSAAAARAQLVAAQAQAQQAGSELELARTTRARTALLVKSGDVSRESADQADAAFAAARQTLAAREAQVVAAQRQVRATEGVLEQARSARLNAPIGRARIASLRSELGATRAQLHGAQAQVAEARAARAQLFAQLAYLNVVSPIDGIVTARAVEPGAVVGSGKTLLTVLDPNTVYLRGFVPEGSIGKVRIGQRARIVLDSALREPLAGHVSEVDTEASFTPENIYFRDERVKQVFGIKIGIDRPQGLAKPGMPADATLLD